MIRMGAEYTVAAGLVALLVLLAGCGIAGASDGAAIRFGVLWGFAVQTGIFWALFVWSLRGRWAVAHGVGALIRFAAVAGMAVVAVPVAGYAAAPVLFSFVACLFGCTLLEPIFLKRQQSTDLSGGMAMIRTES